jgi:hypothetical protein
VARKTKLTPEIRDRIVQALEADNYRDTACRLAGVHPVKGASTRFPA